MSNLKEKFPKVFEFFQDDEFAASTFINKYLLRTKSGEVLEDDPNQTIDRVMSTLAEALDNNLTIKERILNRFAGNTENRPSKSWLIRVLGEGYFEELDRNNFYSWKNIFIRACNQFKGVCPQGSVLSAAGNKDFPQSLSNCFVIEPPYDSISGIMKTGELEAQLMKRRGGVGMDISTLRPKDSNVQNAARTSSGAVGWMEHFSNVCRAVGQCLHPDTLVLTERGLIRIEEVELGDKVWTENKWAKVLNKVKNTKDTYKIITKYGREIIASKDHVFHSENKEVRLKNLVPGSKITSIYGLGWTGNYQELLPLKYEKSVYNQSNRLNPDVKLPKVLDEELAYFLGQTYGDGYIVPHSVTKKISGIEVATSNKFPKIRKKIIDAISNKFNISPKISPGDGACKEVGFYSREIVEFLKLNEILKEKAADITFPKLLLQSPTSVIMSFIAGFFDADGCSQESKKVYKIASINKNFLLVIQTVLLAHGVISKISKEDRESLGWNHLYTLSINGNKSQKLFKELMVESVKVQSHKPWVSKVRDFNRTNYTVKNLNSLASRHNYIINNNQKITYSTLERLTEDLNLNWSNYNLLEDEVVKIQPVKKNETVYDISLDHTNFFFGNGFYVHNSGRRGALMLTLDIKHPDAAEFAKIKTDLTKVTGANISLKLTNEFMQAVRSDSEFTQQWPIDSEFPETVTTVKARELWKTVCECAWRSAEPGLIFWDNALENLPAQVYDDFKSTSTNPCSEIILSNFDSCRLTTICLTNYVENKFQNSASFNFKKFDKDVRTAMRLMDALVSAELDHVDKIIDKILKDQSKESCPDKKKLYVDEIEVWRKIKAAAINGRRTGLGTHGLGDALAQLCLKYDSDEAINMVSRIYESLKLSAYDESIEMARDYGSFPVFNFQKEINSCKFIQRLPQPLLDKMKRYGRRNIAILTNAPTGSISILSQVSSGIEPTFRQTYIRRRKINQNETNARVDFVDQSGDRWTEFSIFEKNVIRYFTEHNLLLPDKITEQELEKVLPNYFVTSDKIDWKKRVEVQAAAQIHIDHSISSTINIPENTTVEQVQEIYEHSHKMGLKGVTVYRDGCRTGVLVTNKPESKDLRPDTIHRQEAPPRPKALPCEVCITRVEGVEYVVIVSFLGDSIYEVFAGEHNNYLPEEKFSGEVLKKKEGVYLLKYKHKGEPKEIDINEYFKNPKYGAITRLVSTALRHGTPIAFIVEQLQKSSEALVGFEKSLARVLKRYSKKEDLARKILANASGDDIEVKFEDGCMTVVNHSKGTVESKCD